MTDKPPMGDIEDLADDPIWWEFHGALWEGEFEEYFLRPTPEAATSGLGGPLFFAQGGRFMLRGESMGELKEWLKLWQGFPGALAKAWGLLAIGVVVYLLLH